MSLSEYETADGIKTFQLDSWSDFHSLVEKVAGLENQLAIPSYVWRGQRDSSWSLSATLDRLFQRLGLSSADDELLEHAAIEHLDSFKLATRGRRVSSPPNDLEWWALGQHFGLATPLLDWTRSPYAAAYFAFIDQEQSSTSMRAIYALDGNAVESKNAEIASYPSLESGRSPVLQILDSLSNENSRLVSQGGLFTRSPVGVSVENWVLGNFEGILDAVLIKIEAPNNERTSFLRGLDRMNINHTSLFPDLIGASHATNLKAELYPEALTANA